MEEPHKQAVFLPFYVCQLILIHVSKWGKRFSVWPLLLRSVRPRASIAPRKEEEKSFWFLLYNKRTSPSRSSSTYKDLWQVVTRIGAAWKKAELFSGTVSHLGFSFPWICVWSKIKWKKVRRKKGEKLLFKPWQKPSAYIRQMVAYCCQIMERRRRRKRFVLGMLLS